VRNPVPWIALAAIAAMFLLPWLDARGLFDGPHTIRRRPRRVVCADCQAPWTPDHHCVGWLEAAVREPVVPLWPVEPPTPQPQRVQLGHPDRRGLPRPERRP
jgi:hypothetical protein